MLRLANRVQRRVASSAVARPVFCAGAQRSSHTDSSPTAILMMNLGGPETTDDVYPFLHRLFSDRDLIPIPFQRYSAPWIARRRSPMIVDQYNAIGGGSPIRSWTEKQGEALVQKLDELSPATAPHKFYIGFRYATPLTEDALAEMEKDGVKRAVAFTQYPQYSCATTGSSLNAIFKAGDVSQQFEWSIIDRWFDHPGFIKTVAKHIEATLETYDAAERDDVVLLFSAHSLPLKAVNRGDPYPIEVASSVTAVMKELGVNNPYRLVWQSKVGPQPWLGPSTEDAVNNMAERGVKNAVLVPIAFTSDHIETLFELDQEYIKMGREKGMTGLKRSESLNDDPMFIDALADIVSAHLKKDGSCLSDSVKHLSLRCPNCTRDSCANWRGMLTGGSV